MAMLAEAWEPHEVFASAARERLDELLATHLPLILNEQDESAAVSLAASLHEDVSLIIAGAR
jgi:predicted FMN-binding regulatory protein PaiB